nr:MAG TPA: hypothetical protein [Caudoviricetes sp.]
MSTAVHDTTEPSNFIVSRAAGAWQALVFCTQN